MNPLFQWIVAHSAARTRLRRCPKCGETQMVPARKLEDTVPCVTCRAPVPPPDRRDTK